MGWALDGAACLGMYARTYARGIDTGLVGMAK